MSNGGYTLVEMLTALAILGLAFGGLSESARVIGRYQGGAARAVTETASREAISRSLRGLMRGSGPFPASSGAFAGQPTSLTFGCGGGGTCDASIERDGNATKLVTSRADEILAKVAAPPGAQFRYADGEGRGASWPAPNSGSLSLRAISLVDTARGETPIATIALPIDEPATCVFDVVAQACRAAP